nr:uncharacterized protein CTRU02_06606 [Colletotrichum truncatum]KAF6792523.1 hypothetical protein CTRU02_06606 [Colletotrichum truncatum]
MWTPALEWISYGYKDRDAKRAAGSGDPISRHVACGMAEAKTKLNNSRPYQRLIRDRWQGSPSKRVI